MIAPRAAPRSYGNTSTARSADSTSSRCRTKRIFPSRCWPTGPRTRALKPPRRSVFLASCSTSTLSVQPESCRNMAVCSPPGKPALAGVATLVRQQRGPTRSSTSAWGARGAGYTDASGKFIARRRIQPGLVDVSPTLTEVCTRSATIGCAAPTNGLNPSQDLDRLVESGRADAVDSVARNVPSLIGFAFNNRQLQGGLAGDPAPAPIGVNPDGLPAGENVAQATATVHRMF